MSVIIVPDTGANEITILSDTGQVLVTTFGSNEIDARLEPVVINTHNSLLELQGGTYGQFYHLTSGQYANNVYRYDLPVYQTGAQTISGVKTFRDKMYASGIKFEVLGTGIYAAPAYEQGLLFYDDANHTLNLYVDNPEVTLQVGQENWVRIKNTLNAPIFNGDLVYIAGGVGANPYVQLAIAGGETTSATTLGMATHNISNNEFGYITTFGLVNNINTKDYAVGDTLYLSPTISGKYTNVKPKAPQHMVRVGTVIRSNENNGVIFVNIQNGLEIDELHDVRIISPQNNQALLYNAASGLWGNRAITTGDVSGLYDFVLNTESEFLTQAEGDALYVSLTGDQNVSGYKNFLYGLSTPYIELPSDEEYGNAKFGFSNLSGETIDLVMPDSLVLNDSLFNIVSLPRYSGELLTDYAIIDSGTLTIGALPASPYDSEAAIATTNLYVNDALNFKYSMVYSGGSVLSGFNLYDLHEKAYNANAAALNNTNSLNSLESSVVYLTQDQTISGVKTFVDRPFVNGTGVMLSGEAAPLPTTIVYQTGNQNISGVKTFVNNAFFSGNIGIGTSSPLSKISILDNNFTTELGYSLTSSANGITIYGTNPGSYGKSFFGCDSYGNTYIKNGSISLFEGNGSYATTIKGNVSYVSAGNSKVDIKSPYERIIMDSYGTNAIQFFAGNNERVRIDNLGRVGIGTTTPSTKLHIQQTAQASTREGFLQFTLSDAGNDTFQIANGTSIDGRFIPTFAGYVDSTNTRESVNLAGLVSSANDTGNTSPAGIVNIYAARTNSTSNPINGTLTSIVNRNIFSVAHSSDFSSEQNFAIIVKPNGRVVFPSAENIGIGTTSPAAKLDISDTTGAASGSLAASALNIAQTWNTTGTPTAIKLDVTDTSSASGSLLMDLRVGGVSRFRVGKTGELYLNVYSTSVHPFFYNGGGNDLKFRGSALELQGVNATPPAVLTFFGSTSILGEAANTLAQRNGANAQTFRLYNTYTDASNYERGFFRWNTNVLQIGAEALGTGTNRNLEFVAGGSTRMTIASGGNIGIGTTPDNNYKLNVNGAARITEGIAPIYGNYAWGFAYHYGGTGVYGGAYASGNNRYITLNGDTSINLHIRNQAGVDFATFAGGSTNVGIGTTSPAAKLDISDTTGASSGSLAASALNISQTWNTTGTPTAIKLNVTDTASNASSLLTDLQVGGVSKFRIFKSGSINISNSLDISATQITFSGIVTRPYIRSESSYGFRVFGLDLDLEGTYALRLHGNPQINGQLIFAHNSSSAVRLIQDAANTLAQRNLTNAQTFRLYNTYTDASNYERGFLRWDTNVLKIGTEKLGTGTARQLEFQTDGSTRMIITNSGLISAMPNLTPDLGSGFRFFDNGSGSYFEITQKYGDFAFNTTAGNQRFTFWANSNTVLAHFSKTDGYFIGTGNFGIGTSSPTAKLTVAGDVSISGHLSAATKSFKIPHQTKSGYLQYGVVESNEHSVYVRGESSEDTIILPDHWEWLVDENSITVQLTSVGKFMPLYIIDKNNKKVTIGGVDGTYNYTIYGTRKDVPDLIVETEE